MAEHVCCIACSTGTCAPLSAGSWQRRTGYGCGFSGIQVRSGGQPDHRASFEAQRRALVATCKRRGWQLLEVVEEAAFSAEELKRPGAQEERRLLESGEA
jgi:hypothetical protein